MTVDELHTKMEAEFKAVRAEIKAESGKLEQRITVEGINVRQHFDVVAEHFKEYTKVVADGSVRNTERLDEHQKRITALERRGS